MKKFALVIAVGGTAALLAACTPAEVGTGINAACQAAGVGSQIAVIATSSVGGATAVTGGTIGNDITQSCAAITQATSTIINQVIPTNGTATLTVKATRPNGKRVVRRMKVRRAA